MRLMKTPIGRLRLIGWVEGLSFLLLLGVAMPLKYMLGMPLAVKLVGWAHGVLFVLFCMALAAAAHAGKWSLIRVGTVFVAALVPFGPFLIDRGLQRDGRAASAGGAPAHP
jgi:integral membrane protein